MDDYFELPEVLAEELKNIEAERGEKRGADYYALSGSDKQSRFDSLLPKLHRARLAALCLSGGGIRSATFNLGMLQALAKNGVLKDVDYLSTVSGGGYIGCWLSSWLSREEGPASGKMDKVVKILAQERPDARCKEPCQVRFLRDYSNYLTPRVGALSADTWAIVGTYLRNLLLNWLVMIPLMFTFLLLPRVISGLLSGSIADAPLAWALVLAGALLGLFPIAYAIADLPSIGNAKQSKSRFICLFLAPLVLMACVLCAYWAHVYRPGCAGLPELMDFVNFGIGVHLVGFTAGILWMMKKNASLPWLPVLAYTLCAVLTGVVAGCLGWAAATKLVPSLLDAALYPKLLYATVSVPMVLAIYLFTGAVVVALLSRFTGDDDREWWGRAAGMVLLAVLAWLAVMATAIYGPYLLLPESTDLWKKIYAAVGAGSGIAAAIFGKDPSTPALRPGESMSKVRTTLLAAAAGLFLLFLAQSLSLLATAIFWLAHHVSQLNVACLSTGIDCSSFPALTSAASILNFDTHLYILCSTPVGSVAAVAAASFLASLLMAVFVDVNKFSMHAMYRNRLVRCYLGASRLERRPNPFTGFDQADNLPMKDLPKRPLHVVNMAWNLVKGKRLAWQQRKAASFVMSPLFAGSDIDSPSKNGRQPGGFRRIEEYGAGKYARTSHPITVGTAMAISGAAASPNMGYHSSPLVTFVMTFFNVRLGWWLGNTGSGMGNAWRIASPGISVRSLLKETFGLTNEQSQDVYLSDGGHFENLGLYEMVRRRCRHIIVCDASCDCDSSLGDLGNAIRKVRADFGIEIEIDYQAILAKKSHFAVGAVKYSPCDQVEDDGVLLYVKPVLTGNEPVDEYNYAKMHHEFPHETTADQWFDEAQFESYRKLGLHSLDALTCDSQKTDRRGSFQESGPGAPLNFEEAAGDACCRQRKWRRRLTVDQGGDGVSPVDNGLPDLRESEPLPVVDAPGTEA